MSEDTRSCPIICCDVGLHSKVPPQLTAKTWRKRLNCNCHPRATYAMPNFFHHTLLLHIPSIHYYPQLELCISSIGYVHPPALFVTYLRLHPSVPVLICINSAVEIYLGREKSFINNSSQSALRNPSHLVAAVGSHVAAASTGTPAHS